MTAEQVSAVGSVVSAAAAVIALSLAIYAARQWRATLRSQRHDECLLALHEFNGAFGRFLSAAERTTLGEHVWEPYNSAWRAYRALRAAHNVLRRYDPALPTMSPAEIMGRLHALQARLHDGRQLSQDEVAGERQQMSVLLGPLGDRLGLEG